MNQDFNPQNNGSSQGNNSGNGDNFTPPAAKADFDDSNPATQSGSGANPPTPPPQSTSGQLPPPPSLTSNTPPPSYYAPIGNEYGQTPPKQPSNGGYQGFPPPGYNPVGQYAPPPGAYPSGYGFPSGSAFPPAPPTSGFTTNPPSSGFPPGGFPPPPPPPPSDQSKPKSDYVFGKIFQDFKTGVKIPSHSLKFDEQYFLRLLAGSISLTKDEKTKIIKSIPKLSQYQIDELIKILEEEKRKFAELSDKHSEQLQKLEKKHAEEWHDIENSSKAEEKSREDQAKADEIRKNLGL